MAQPKPLFIPWLQAQIDSGRFPGVAWTNPGRAEFSVPWKHALRQDSSSTDVLIFKRNFRSTLRAKHFTMVTDNRNDSANPTKVFRWPEEGPSPSTSSPSTLSPSTSSPASTAPPPVESQEEEQLSHPVQEMCPEDWWRCVDAHGSTINPDDFEDCLLGLSLQPTEELQQPFEELPAGTGLPEQQLSPLAIGVEGGAEPYPTVEVGAVGQGGEQQQVVVTQFMESLSHAWISLTQKVLDSLGSGLEVGVSASVVYSHRHGDAKAFWSLSKFDRSAQPQEVAKMEPQGLFLFGDFAKGMLDFIKGGECPSCCLYLCLGERWPDPDCRPWEKKLVMVEHGTYRKF
ncbi:hypothetical protein CRUP_001432 [Coryphaenoides rupestris]|nr:hypothetical protein CRUP_001432 [Coryphaenoides rupestris]